MAIDVELLALGAKVASGYLRDFATRLALPLDDVSALAQSPDPTNIEPAPAAAAPADRPENDLRLSDAIRRPLSPALVALEMEFHDADRVAPITRRQYHITQIQNHSVNRTLLQVSDDILLNARTDGLDKLNDLGVAFLGSGTDIYVLSERVDLPAAAIDNVLKNMWSKIFQVRADFIPSQYVRGLEQMSLADQIDFVQTRFALPEKQRTTRAVIDDEEIELIVKSLVTFADFGDVRGRRTLLGQELVEAVNNVDLQGAPNTVATMVVLYVARNPKPALGSLVRKILGLPNLPPARAAELQTLIERRKL